MKSQAVLVCTGFLALFSAGSFANINFTSCPSNYQTLPLGISLQDAKAACPSLVKINETKKKTPRQVGQKNKAFRLIYLKTLANHIYKSEFALVNNKVAGIFVNGKSIQHTTRCLLKNHIIPGGIKVGDSKKRLLLMCGMPYKYLKIKLPPVEKFNEERFSIWQLAHGTFQAKDQLTFKNDKLIEIKQIT